MPRSPARKEYMKAWKKKWRERLKAEGRIEAGRERERAIVWERAWKARNPEKVLLKKQRYRQRQAERLHKAMENMVPLQSRLRMDALYASVWPLLSEIKDVETREDIAAEAIILLLEGTAATPAEAVKLGRKRHWSMFSRFGSVSLDEVRPNGRTLHETIADDHPHF